MMSDICPREKLGLSRVAVVLPARNRAFHRTVVCDGLKTMRRGLQAQLVFVAPGGSAPAEFARQRRFPVYPSLAEYAQTLQEDFQDQDTSDIGRVFGGRQTPARSPASSSASETEEPQPPPALPGSPLAERASAMQPEDQRTTGDS